MNNQLKQWAKEQWENSIFGDARRTKRAVKIAIDLVNKPAESLPCQLSNWKDLKGGYRFFNSQEISHESVQKNHRDLVLKTAAKESVVLFIQDTSSLDYTSHSENAGLGPIGKYKEKGIFIQSVLAVSYDQNNPKILGLAHQIAWMRDPAVNYSTETNHAKMKRSRESSVWKDTLSAMSKPKNALWVSVGDRANDIFDFFIFCQNSDWNYLIRASQNRVTVSNDGGKICLKDWARTLPCEVQKTIYLRSRKESLARTINLNVSWGKVTLLMPEIYGKKYKDSKVDVWCIRCWEDAPNGIEWILLTNLPILNKESALEKVDWYSARWLIEEYHKCLKTGCAIEKRQLRTSKGLLAIIGFLSIIAIKLLELKFIARNSPNELAKKYVAAINLQIICSHFKLEQASITLQQYWHRIAQLGGFIGRKSDGDPGWQTLWKGQLRLLDMISGAESIKNCG